MSDYAKQPRRKFCQFCKEDTQYIDYKDTQCCASTLPIAERSSRAA